MKLLRVLALTSFWGGAVGFAPSLSPAFAIVRSSTSTSLLSASVEVDDALPPAITRLLDSVRHSIGAEQQMLLDAYHAMLRSHMLAAEEKASAAAEKAILQVALAEKDVQLMGCELKETTAQLMRYQGLLHMRGILEYVEQRYKRGLAVAAKEKRHLVWERILKDSPKLAECIQSKTGWNVGTAAQRISSLYDNLNKHSHVGYADEEWTLRDVVVISDAHQASALDCNTLACICEHARRPYELRFKAAAEE